MTSNQGEPHDKKPLRLMAHKQQITANQKLKSEGGQTIGLEEDEQRSFRAKRFALFH